MVGDDLLRLRQELLFSALRGVEGSSSLAFTMFQELAVSIVEGRLPPGHEVNSAELARRFSTSRTPVREALLLLEREDLVVVPPRRRPYVSPVALSQVREIYEIRASLYALVSELVVERASDEEIAGLAAWQKLLEQDARDGEVDAYFWHNVGFRNHEASLAKNGELQRRLSSLGLQMHRFRHLSLSLPGRLLHSLADHERLVRAYADRDAGLAAAVSRSLVMRGYRAIESSGRVT
ncbi:GntR family transcriptional regulator [Amycolatopsis acidiphila]|uniref:GntR family transcriptional regulator n=1 Tax=Amycolatopsis acidiphila TaxID=715473 RepID=A0A558A635_9PSEU|nr:GntR family transcriptional regulator [Amycolatopsis acidiphila]TVT19733.1 GntR family transcriptional regulator [Amycolatopsis acidiphila]UIJ61909.1 GntR family transcriptional regulator [Amycolatopsis acidiphila]GHG57216.1 GntR family transcriptional regulator [Amycolatopsis acidiphila]